jgi:hypothetical protein
MKLAAWRDAIDREIWRQIESFLPPNDVQKASYAFDDLWESVHGPS